MATAELAAVTGAGRGIGLATTLELARRGYRVLALVEHASMAAAVTDAAAGLAVRVDVLDVRDPGAFAFPDTLTVLVNNAGARRAFLPVEHVPEADWRDVFDVNFFGLVELTRRAIGTLRANGGGVICNVTSSAVLDLGPFFGAYRCSKVAASALCEALRIELAPFGIRMVEIMPGPTQTVMASDGISARVAEAVGFTDYAPMARRQRDLLAGQPGFTPVAEVARSIVDAIEDEGGPMRYGTDRLSRDRLVRWRTEDDERRMADTLKRYAP